MPACRFCLTLNTSLIISQTLLIYLLSEGSCLWRLNCIEIDRFGVWVWESKCNSMATPHQDTTAWCNSGVFELLCTLLGFVEMELLRLCKFIKNVLFSGNICNGSTRALFHFYSLITSILSLLWSSDCFLTNTDKSIIYFGIGVLWLICKLIVPGNNFVCKSLHGYWSVSTLITGYQLSTKVCTRLFPFFSKLSHSSGKLGFIFFSNKSLHCFLSTFFFKNPVKLTIIIKTIFLHKSFEQTF